MYSPVKCPNRGDLVSEISVLESTNHAALYASIARHF